jgi:uroporphyrinogen-III synthase
MSALHGVAVLVTRPEHQAAALCSLLEAQGATVIRWPVLRIKPTEFRQGPGLGPLDSFELIVFTSANAVRFGAALLGDNHALRLAAIGPATAAALHDAGFPVAVTPTLGFDSEHLLLDPALQNCAGRRILIVTGTRGRDLLRERLSARGAHVAVVEVYERECVHREPAQFASLAASCAAGAVDVITATSVDIAACLFALATPPLRREFDRVHWVVPSARVATALRERGLLAPLLRADSAKDHDLVAAIARWRSNDSGA